MNEVTLSIVRDLIGISEARRIGYQNALSKISNDELKENIKNSIEQSKVFVKALTPFIEEDPFEIIHELVKPVHNEWLKVEQVSNTSIVELCWNAERTTVKALESSLQENLPIEIQIIVSKKLMDIDSKMKYLKGLNL